MNQALGFGLVIAGGVLITSVATRSSIADVVQGHAGTISHTGMDLNGSPNTATTGTVGGVGSTISTLSGLSGSVSNVVDQLSRAKGWGAGEAQAWMQVIQRESGGSLTATNSSSGAYGIAQFINGPSEYAQYGGNSRTVPGQLTAMANYIQQRYGTPSAAWAHEETYGWY